MTLQLMQGSDEDALNTFLPGGGCKHVCINFMKDHLEDLFLMQQRF